MKYWIISVALVAGLLGVALSGANEYLFFAGFVVLQFVVLATAWNILGGYAGYVNFGVPALWPWGPTRRLRFSNRRARRWWCKSWAAPSWRACWVFWWVC